MSRFAKKFPSHRNRDKQSNGILVYFLELCNFSYDLQAWIHGLRGHPGAKV